MKTRVRRIPGGKVLAKKTENVDSLHIVDGTEIPEGPANELAVELNLEERIAKLKQDHRQVLEKLHEEVDQLKRQNQDLQFQIAFGDVHTLGGNATAGGHTRRQIGKLTSQQTAVEKNRVHSAKKMIPQAKGGLQLAPTTSQNHEILAAAAAAATAAEVNQTPASSLERQIGELRRKLKQEKCHSIELINKLAAENARKMPHETGNSLTQRHTRTLNRNIKKTSKKPDTKRSCPLPFDAKLEPFLVHNKRPPTAEECEAIIKTLKERVEKQSNEIISIRTDLKDVIETHKLTPESFLLAKYYAQETSVCSNIVKCTCNQRKSSGRQPVVVSMPDHGQLPAEKLNHRIRKSGYIFRQITCNPLVW